MRQLFFMNEKKVNPTFKEWVVQAEAALKDTFEAFLITPIQRPPRYQLLLKELIKYTDETSPEKDFLSKLLQLIILEIARVDKGATIFEEGVKMAEIQSRIIDFEVMKTGRRFYAQCECQKQSRKKKEERHLIMFSDLLLVCETTTFGKLKINKKYTSGEYVIQPYPDQDNFINAIDIKHTTKSFRCDLPDISQKRKFLQAFEELLKDKELDLNVLIRSEYSPIWIPDELEPACSICQSKFTMIKRRHHCRQCGRVVCKDCWSVKAPSADIPSKLCKDCFAAYTSPPCTLR